MSIVLGFQILLYLMLQEGRSDRGGYAVDKLVASVVVGLTKLFRLLLGAVAADLDDIVDEAKVNLGDETCHLGPVVPSPLVSLIDEIENCLAVGDHNGGLSGVKGNQYEGKMFRNYCGTGQRVVKNIDDVLDE